MSDAPILGDYSLWLVPAGQANEALTTIIKDLAASQPTSPAFQPHITLWYPIPISTPVSNIISDLQTLISRVKANDQTIKWDMQLLPAQTGDKYYQSVLAPVKPDPRLLALREECEKFWGPRDKVFFPHLSLFYGDVSRDTRERIAERAKGLIRDVQDGQSGPSHGAATTEKVDLEIVRVGEVVIVDTRGSADQWKVVGSVEL